MKNTTVLSMILIVTLSLVALSLKTKSPVRHVPVSDETNRIDVPENVQSILNRSCLPCHGADGSGKAKMKWNFEKMPEYSKTKLISKLVKIANKVEKGKMPPPKNLKKNPDRKLSEEDKNILIKWADSVAEDIVGGTE